MSNNRSGLVRHVGTNLTSRSNGLELSHFHFETDLRSPCPSITESQPEHFTEAAGKIVGSGRILGLPGRLGGAPVLCRDAWEWEQTRGQAELARFDGHLKEGTNNPEELFDDQAQEIHIGVQARSGAAPPPT